MHAFASTSRALLRGAAAGTSQRIGAVARQSAVIAPRAAASPACAARSFASSSQRKADSHHSSAADSEYVTQEGFSAPIWRNTLFVLIAGVIAYRLSEMQNALSPPKASSSGHSAPVHGDEHGEDEEEDTRPFLTRYMDYYNTPSEVYKERNAQHYDLMKAEAEKKLFFQDAERPPVHRFRYPQTFEQASPHGLPVGAVVDLSDLKVKSDNE